MDEATSAATGTPQPTTRTQSAAKTDWTGLFGYDMFLSYRREEASGFAAALAQDLARLDFTCFLDRADAPAGMRLEPHIGRALDRSKVLIVVVTKEAPNSPWVTMEVDRFLSVRPRPVIPLDVNGRYLSLVPDATPWGRLRKLNLITAEASSEEIASGQPSPDLARKVEATFQYLKANTRRRIATSVVAGVLIVTTAFAVWKAVQATGARSKLNSSSRAPKSAST